RIPFTRFQCGGEIRFCRLHRRNKAEQKCTPDRNKEREYEYAVIKPEDQVDRRVPDNCEAGEHLDHLLRHEQADSAASQRDQQVLRHQLPYEPEPACTNCEANGEFAPSRTSAAKRQVCNIGASDQQNNSDKPEQESEKASIKRRQVEPCLNLGVNGRAEAAVRIRIGLFEGL